MADKNTEQIKPAYDHLFKVILLGDSGVGKSNLLLRYTRDLFELETKSTLGVEFATRIVEMGDGKKIKAQIWDTAGQERFRTITNAYYHGALGALVAYDTSSQSSFESMTKWIADINDNSRNEVKIVIVGNKTDILEKEVTTEQGQAFADSLGLSFFEASAKSGDGVSVAFKALLNEIYKDPKLVQLASPGPTVGLTTAPQEIRKLPPCCQR